MENYNFSENKSGKNSPFKIKWFGLAVAMFWAFFLALAISNVLSPYLSNIVNGLLSGITPLVIGIVVAFIFHRLVNFTENVIFKNAFKNSPYKFAIKRTISIFIVFLIIIGIFILVFSILVPKIIDVVKELTTGGGDGWDQMVNNVVNEICILIQNWFGAEVEQASVMNILNSLFDLLKDTVFYIDGLMEISMGFLSAALNFLMGMILAVLILKDKEKISRFSRRFVYANFKKDRADELCVLTQNSGKILFDYVLCKLIEFALLFVALGVTYTILGLRFTWELALIIGIFNFIPYYGIYIGAVPSIMFTLIFNSMNAALYMAIATFVVSTIVLNILVPVITGNKLKVSALVVTASIVIGGAMFGFIGMLVAPPVAAIISVIIMGNIELKENHMKYVMQLKESRERNKADQKASMVLPEIKEDELIDDDFEESEIEERAEYINNRIEEDNENVKTAPQDLQPKKQSIKKKTTSNVNQDNVENKKTVVKRKPATKKIEVESSSKKE